MVLNRPALKKFRVPELKALIRKYTLGKVSGNKSTLIDRIGSSKKWNEIRNNETIPIRKKKVFSKKQLEAQQRFKKIHIKENTTEELDIQAEQELTEDELLQLEEDQKERNKVVNERERKVKELLNPSPLLDITIKKDLFINDTSLRQDESETTPVDIPFKAKFNFVEFIREKQEEVGLMKENNTLRDIIRKIVGLFNKD